MIISRLRGGLGNQLFQYAAGRRLALQHRVPLALDDRDFARLPDREYALAPFMIDASLATDQQIARVRRRSATLVGRLLRRLTSDRLPRSGHFLERSLAFDPRVLQLPDHVYLDGYWQSEKYFADVEERIRCDLQLRVAPTGRNAEHLEHICAVDAVSVHVRRGDYTAHPSLANVCTPAYYAKCTRRIREICSTPTFFIFSDDPGWAQENLELPGPATFVSGNANRPHEDLRLMSHCRHHVIANSSFSWWGAWLAGPRAGIVLAPGTWSWGDDSRESPDRLPPHWLRV